ncbi:MAG: deoxyribodipyrimidine photo-lyase [Pseudomonadota bacterium]
MALCRGNPMTDEKKIVVWFRQDLRLTDNPALAAAAREGAVLPIFILDDNTAGDWKHGGAARVWLHHSLTALNASLDGHLSVYCGDANDVITDILERLDISAVYWNRCYEPWRIARDKTIKQNLTDRAVTVRSFNGSLLWEPWEIAKPDGTPYRVFTPFYRKGCLNAPAPRKPSPKPRKMTTIADAAAPGIESLGLLPKAPRWDTPITEAWRIGEKAAQKTLDAFLKTGLEGYKKGRDFPARANVSRLSPHLRWGEISPHTVWARARSAGDNDDVDHFCSELGWREFSCALLYHFPDLPTQNFQPKFDGFPWADNNEALAAWRRGATGVPIVDAGMRELWRTGYMHNRVRMIVASFLIKGLRIDWREGERWFWDTLVDADLANNSASWQWVAGSGADAAPYFRIFNPVTQAEKFDPDGAYIKRYVPELSGLDGKPLYAPWTAPEDLLAAAHIKLGEDYPHPIADLKQSREEALAAFKALS